jgi:hypothetical protein
LSVYRYFGQPTGASAASRETSQAARVTAVTDNDGMRALLAAINCPKGAVEANLDSHLRLMEGVAPRDLVLFPEMSLTGYLDPNIAANSLADGELLGLWIAEAGQAGVTRDEDFPGLTGPDGVVTGRLPDWRAGVLTVTIPAEPGA